MNPLWRLRRDHSLILRTDGPAYRLLRRLLPRSNYVRLMACRVQNDTTTWVTLSVGRWPPGWLKA